MNKFNKIYEVFVNSEIFSLRKYSFKKHLINNDVEINVFKFDITDYQKIRQNYIIENISCLYLLENTRDNSFYIEATDNFCAQLDSFIGNKLFNKVYVISSTLFTRNIALELKNETINLFINSKNNYQIHSFISNHLFLNEDEKMRFSNYWAIQNEIYFLLGFKLPFEKNQNFSVQNNQINSGSFNQNQNIPYNQNINSSWNQNGAFNQNTNSNWNQNQNTNSNWNQNQKIPYDQNQNINSNWNQNQNTNSNWNQKESFSQNSNWNQNQNTNSNLNQNRGSNQNVNSSWNENNQMNQNVNYNLNQNRESNQKNNFNLSQSKSMDFNQDGTISQNVTSNWIQNQPQSELTEKNSNISSSRNLTVLGGRKMAKPNNPIFYCRDSKLKIAKGGYILLKGSRLFNKKWATTSNLKKTEKFKVNLVLSRKVDENGYLKENYFSPHPSALGLLVCGETVNGYEVFKTAEGITLNNFLGRNVKKTKLWF